MAAELLIKCSGFIGNYRTVYKCKGCLTGYWVVTQLLVAMVAKLHNNFIYTKSIGYFSQIPRDM